MNRAPSATLTREHLVIDCLRGLAALGVVIFHARVSLWVGWSEIRGNPANYSAFDQAAAWLSAPAPFLGSLVMLFFVVSGFCVHQPIDRGMETLDYSSFYQRRFLRVYPPYLAAVAVSFAISYLLVLPVPSTGHIVATALMAQNYLASAGLPVAAGQPASNPALWSLPVEMELYLIYPAVWLLARTLGWRGLFMIVGVVSASALAAYHLGLRFLEGNFAMYWMIWCGGAWLREQTAAGALRPMPRSLIAVAAVALLAAAWLTWRGIRGVTNLCWGLFYFCAVWWLLSGRGAWVERNGWEAKALSTLGRWSYSLYLLHFPLLLVLGGWWVAQHGSKPSNYLLCLLASMAILPVVWLFHRVIEQPSHRWARRAARSTKTSS